MIVDQYDPSTLECACSGQRRNRLALRRALNFEDHLRIRRVASAVNIPPH